MAKSYTFKIGADTSDFIKQLKKADSQIKQTEKLGNALEQGLQLKFDETNFVLAQKKVREALEQTENKASAIKQKMELLQQSGEIDSTSYEKLRIELTKTENEAIKLNLQLERLRQIKLTNLINNLNNVGKSITGLGTTLRPISTLAVATIGGLTALGKSAISTADDIATLASQYGITTEEIQRLQYIAMQSDVEDTTLYKGLKKLNVALADLAMNQTSTATQALIDLGLDENTTFEKLVSTLIELDDITLQTYYASQIFGDNIASNLIPLFQQSVENIKSYNDEFEAIGYLTDEAIQKFATFDNVMNNIKARFKEMAMELGYSILPLMQSFSDLIINKFIPKLQELANLFGNLSLNQQEFIVKLLLFTAVLSPAIIMIGKLITGLSSILKIIPMLSSALSLLEAHPIITMIGAIVTLIGVLYTRNEQLRDSLNDLFSTIGMAISPLMNTLLMLLEDIFNILNPIIDLMGTGLARQIKYLTTLLKPIALLISWITEGLQWIIDKVEILIGKGWLWGVDDNPSESESSMKITTTTSSSNLGTTIDTGYGVSNTTTNNNTNNTTTSNIYNINIEANEYTTAEEVAKILALKLQSRS